MKKKSSSVIVSNKQSVHRQAATSFRAMLFVGWFVCLFIANKFYFLKYTVILTKIYTKHLPRTYLKLI